MATDMRQICQHNGIDGDRYANTTYISEFHPHIPAACFSQKRTVGPLFVNLTCPLACVIRGFELSLFEVVRRHRDVVLNTRALEVKELIVSLGQMDKG